MFDEWKHAWRQAVMNFRRELDGGEPQDGAPTAAAVQRELTLARGVLRRLDSELRQADAELRTHRDEEATCLRRQTQAERIGDAETARLAAEYARRAAEHARIAERKVAVLREERALRARDLEAMETIARERHGVSPGTPSAASEPDAGEREAVEFRRMEQAAREKAADARLEELRRRMSSQ